MAYINQMHEEISSEVELEELDFLFDKWKGNALSKNLDIQELAGKYLSAKADGETLRNPETAKMARVTYEAQKRTRNMVINQIIYLISAKEIDQTEKAAISNPSLKNLRGEIRDDAEYLRRMLPAEFSIEHPNISENRYRSICNEIARLTQKVLSKL